MARSNVFIKCKIRTHTKRRIMKKWIKQFLKYIREPENEFGFMVLSLLKKWTYFPANIFIDDGGLWTNIGNKKIILFQINNSNYCDFNKIIPMSIENTPQIFSYNEKIDLSNFEIEQIKDFVKKCQEELILLADGKIEVEEFSDRIKIKGFFYGNKNEQDNS